jgi:hypothetical protein
MSRVTELRIRADWGLVKFAYLPVLAAGIASSKYLWPVALFSFRVAPCGICILLSRWGHHIEEWFNRKPLLRLTDYGFQHEDGGEPVEYAWSDVLVVSVHRRNTIPPWRTNGSTEITPPYWLSITVREGSQPRSMDEGYIDRDRYLPSHASMLGEAQNRPRDAADEIELSGQGYVDRSTFSAVTVIDSSLAADENIRTICVWPRQVVGGLFSLMRFARELQRQLLERADRGEIPMLKAPPRARSSIISEALRSSA